MYIILKKLTLIQTQYLVLNKIKYFKTHTQLVPLINMVQIHQEQLNNIQIAMHQKIMLMLIYYQMYIYV